MNKSISTKFRPIYVVHGCFWSMLIIIGSALPSYITDRQFSRNILIQAALVYFYVGIITYIIFRYVNFKKYSMKVVAFFVVPVLTGICAIVSLALVYHSIANSITTVLGAWAGYYIYFFILAYLKIKHDQNDRKRVGAHYDGRGEGRHHSS